jgi:glutamate-1-semialdehyde aminotransferase
LPPLYAGVPASTVAAIITATYNDLESRPLLSRLGFRSQCCPTHSFLLTHLSLAVFAGVPASTAAATLNGTYNDLESVKALFAANKGEIAGVILEPVVGNSGFIVPTKEFLQVRL